MHASDLAGATRLGGLAVPLVAFWLLLSGHYTGLLLTLGTVSVVAVLWLSHRMGADHGDGPLRLWRPHRILGYSVWLAVEIARSSVVVLKQVWSPRLDPRPGIGFVPTSDLSEIATVTYANSITLTPGTLAMRLAGDAIEVHALRAPDLDELRSGTMLERVRRLEGS